MAINGPTAWSIGNSPTLYEPGMGLMSNYSPQASPHNGQNPIRADVLADTRLLMPTLQNLAPWTCRETEGHEPEMKQVHGGRGT